MAINIHLETFGDLNVDALPMPYNPNTSLFDRTRSLFIPCSAALSANVSTDPMSEMYEFRIETPDHLQTCTMTILAGELYSESPTLITGIFGTVGGRGVRHLIYDPRIQGLSTGWTYHQQGVYGPENYGVEHDLRHPIVIGFGIGLTQSSFGSYRGATNPLLDSITTRSSEPLRLLGKDLIQDNPKGAAVVLGLVLPTDGDIESV